MIQERLYKWKQSATWMKKDWRHGFVKWQITKRLTELQYLQERKYSGG